MPVCTCCNRSFPAFLDFGVVPRPNAQCPGCGSLERHRLLWLYLRSRTNIFTDPLRVLHVAPEPVFQKALQGLANLRYVSADLHSPHAMVAMDMTRAPIADGSFDAVLCSHVLEHIPDDRAAMREIRRILAPDGWAILQVPIDSSLEFTFEDPTVTSPADRQRLFGQRDHVRMYGRDYRSRLEQAGFLVTVDRFVDELSSAAAADYCVLDEDIYFCRRADDPAERRTTP